MDKVYEPTTIPDVPFPADNPVTNTLSASSQSQVTSPTAITDSPMPTPVIAQELLSTALNTRSKKIVQDFQFAASGALQIGTFTEGLNGDVRISQNGITARDLAGNTTFDIDGDTGDAIFAGQVREGSTVTGSVEITQGGSIIMYDVNGVPSIIIGDFT